MYAFAVHAKCCLSVCLSCIHVPDTKPPFTAQLAVPALGLEYYKSPAAAKCTSLRAAIFSGEAMPLELVELIYRNVPKGVTVYNAYGGCSNF